MNTTDRVDISDTGNPVSSYGVNVYPREVSCDGRYVVLASGSSSFVTGDTNGVSDIFLLDRLGGYIVKDITLNANGASAFPKISCDGNYILFASSASNLVASDTNNTSDLFRYKVSDGTIDRVSIKDDETEYAGHSSAGGSFSGGTEFDMSMDGRFVFFLRQQNTPSNYLTMRDTKLGTTSDIATSASNYLPGGPASSYDGSKVYYVVSQNNTDFFGALKLVTGHLPS